MPTHLILTVGTGTAGTHSNLAAGLRRTLEMMAPDRFWLVPSEAETSRLTADLVREGVAGFQPWSPTSAYRCIEYPDSLEDCRGTVREVIAAARQRFRNVRLLVNPTSGTKQMSVGAALAALDEGIGELVFTVGERADGVVKTGTEKLETFDAAGYFAERDLALARTLAAAGAFDAAERLLEAHGALWEVADTARCLLEWERQNYAEARRIAACSAAPALVSIRRPLEELAKAARDPAPPPLIVADMLQTADHWHRRRDYEAAMVLACRALEMGLRHALFLAAGICEPYGLDDICALPVGEDIIRRCRAVSIDGSRTILNLRTVACILRDLGHPAGAAYCTDGELQALVRVRNDLMHQLRAVSDAESRSLIQRVRNALECLNLPSAFVRPAL
jgi:hypothetical protein